ncbi:MAG: tetratricopeptide repeat protein [Sphingomonadales bacterium]|jgi:tetratricopeptide (TPR) repeat protein
MHANDLAILQQALAALRAGQPGQAGALLARLSQAGQQHPDSLYVAALTAQALGRADAAEQCFAAAIAANPRNPGYRNSHGLFLQRQGRLAEAAQELEAAVAAAPGHGEAWYNLALVAQERCELDAAAAALGRVRAVEGETPRVLAAAGALAQSRGNEADARSLLGKALASRPDDAAARLRLAVALMQQRDFDAALATLAAAPAADPTLAAQRGDILVEAGRLGEAMAAYRDVLARWPQHHPVLTAMSFLMMQASEGADRAAALGLWDAALGPDAPADLWQAAITAAIGLGDAERTAAWAAQAEAATGGQPAWRMARLTALRLAGDYPAYLARCREEEARFPDDAGFAAHRAWAALRQGSTDEAEQAATRAARLRPLEQTGWALLGTAWRLMGDAREQWLLDYETMVSATDLVTPRGWASTPAFLADLKAVLERRHVMLNAPAEQTLRGGTQTPGDLFATTDPVLIAFRDALRETIHAALSRLRPDPDHPFLGRLTGRVRLLGGWSVRLRGQGFHVNHVHPRGWLSSAFYVSLPPEVGVDGDAGKLTFGVPDQKLGLDLAPRRIITPVAGRLALFPSYAWHGTVPFQSETPRLTAAFDALPV